MRATTLLRLLRFWPPYAGAGVRVTEIAPDLSSIEVQMKLRFWNWNYFRTQFGGSLYSMVDPFYVLLLSEGLGRGYEVWDKAASIRFKKPGRGTVKARFELSRARIEAIRREADLHPKHEPVFSIEIVDEEGDTVAVVEKLLHVRRRDKVSRKRAA